VRGPKPQPIPRSSNRTVKTTAFWSRIGSVHQSRRWASVLMPGVSDVIQRMPAA
jgi:hypothetical protein